MDLGYDVRQMNLNTQKTKLEELKMERIKNFFNDESGAAAVEYGLLVGLIAVAIVVTVGALGTKLSGLFDSIEGSIPAGGA
jgi:pilus assembly protein Flp/PilA